MIENANLFVAVHAVTLAPVVVTLPSGRTYRIPQGSVFLSSPPPAHAAALAGLVRALDWDTDHAAPVEGDKALFVRHRGRFFNIAYDNAPLAVRIEPYKEPAPSIIIRAFPQREPAPPVMRTGFEY